MSSSETFDIKASVIASVQSLFDTMLSMEVALSEGQRADNLQGARLTGSLTFAGEVLGVITFQTSREFAQTMTAAMLGMEAEEVESEEEIKDVIREACNIIGGNLKSGFEDAGLACAISTPTITIGEDFHVETLNMDRYEFLAFRSGEQSVYIELAVRAADEVPPEARARLKSVDITKFQRLDIISTAGDSTIELFSMMLSMELEMVDNTQQSDVLGERMMALVNFAGEVVGSLSIEVSHTFSRQIAAAMLGLALEKVEKEEEIKDVVGEVCNIIAGNLKAGFCDSGLTCKISTPTITSGQHFHTETAAMDRRERFVFKHGTNLIFVEICVKIEEAAKAAASAPPPPAEPLPGTAAAASDTPPASSAPPPIPMTDTAGAPAPEPARNATAPAAAETTGQALPKGLEFILDIPLEITVELGRTRMKIEELLKLGPGSAMTLSNLEGEPLDILANNTLIARGEVMVENEKYGIRITEIVSPRKRLESLK
jgi:flagellar motor switch protein FliN